VHNPLKSEAEAFRMVVIVGLGAAAVIALALITEPVYGAVLGAALIGVGAGVVWQASRGSEPRTASVARRDDSVHRVLVVANRTVGGAALLEEISNRCRGRDCELLVVVPALASSRLDHWASAVDGAIEAAEERMLASLDTLRAEGIDATGVVGDSDPNMAIEDALRDFPADEMIISTLPEAESKWIEHGVVERARAEVPLPITHVIGSADAQPVV
jgi:hypothetical protein